MSHFKSYWQVYLTATLGLLLNAYAYSSFNRYLQTRFNEASTQFETALEEIDRHCTEASQQALTTLVHIGRRHESVLDFYRSASATTLRRMGLENDGLIWPLPQSNKAQSLKNQPMKAENSASVDTEQLTPLPTSASQTPGEFLVLERRTAESKADLFSWPEGELQKLFESLPKSQTETSASRFFMRTTNIDDLAGQYIYLIRQLPLEKSTDLANRTATVKPIYLFSRYRWEDLLEEALVQSGLEDNEMVSISLEDSSSTFREQPASMMTYFKYGSVGTLKRIVDLKIANATFSVIHRPSAQFFNTIAHRLLQWSLLAGTLIAILMTWMVRAVVLSRNRKEKLVSQLSDTQVQLEGALKREQDYSGMKSRFVNVLTHEIRNPLGVILWGAQSLQRYRENLSKEQEDTQFHNIRRSIHRVKGLMEETLLIGKLEQEQFSATIAPVNLEELCHEICDEFRVSSGYQSRLELHSALESSIQSDQNVIRHVITNLIDNALKYSPSGKPVSVRLCQTANQVVLEFQDHGIGIPKSEHDQVFDNFQRGSNVANIQGTGLGLPLVKQCVSALKGTIHLESSPSIGTCIRVELPIQYEQQKRNPES